MYIQNDRFKSSKGCSLLLKCRLYAECLKLISISVHMCMNQLVYQNNLYQETISYLTLSTHAQYVKSQLSLKIMPLIVVIS